MPCGAIAYFDSDTDGAVRGLWQVIDDAGLPSTMLTLTYPPHLTLLACDEMAMDGLRQEIAAFVAGQPPLPLTFSGFGVFPGPPSVVYLAITPDRALLEFHARLWSIAGAHMRPGDGYYEPNTWVPHVTLDYNLPPEASGAVITALTRANWPRRGRLHDLVLAGFSISSDGVGADSYTELFKARLGSRGAEPRG